MLDCCYRKVFPSEESLEGVDFRVDVSGTLDLDQVMCLVY